VILYLDTSSLVKLYVDEPGSPDVRGLVEEADVVTASVVAYPEARAALARRRRELSLTAGEHRRAKAALDADWPRILALDVVGPLAWSAGDLAERQGLRGFDAVHLASYLTIAREFPDEDVAFSSADSALASAASRAVRASRRRRKVTRRGRP
jgi:predicted nucleic acid-binding protein